MGTTIDDGLQTGRRRASSRLGGSEPEGLPEQDEAPAATQLPEDEGSPSPQPHKTCSDGTSAPRPDSSPKE